MQNNFSYILERLSSRAQRVLVAAQKLSEELRHSHTGTEHLLYGIITEKSSFGSEILQKNNVKPSEIREEVVLANKANIVPVWTAKISNDLKSALEKAAIEASRYNFTFIATEHLLYGLLDEERSTGKEILAKKGFEAQDLKKQLAMIFEHSSKFPDFMGMEEQVSGLAAISPKSISDEKIAKSQALDYFTVDLTDRASKGLIDPVIGREAEIERLISILNRRTKNNPVLIGEPGVGKTAIVEGLALKITKGEVPDSLVNKKILALDLALVVAGSMFRGEFENRLKQVIEEVAENKNIILFIDELHTLVGAGATTGSLDAANILKPALARGELRAIGATTLTEHKKHIESDPALERRFQAILIEEPSMTETVAMIAGIRGNYERHHNVLITEEAIKAAVELSVRYLPDKFLPDKALDLIDEASANLKTKNERSPKVRLLGAIEKQLNSIAQEKTRAVLSQDFLAAQSLRTQESKLRDEKNKYEEELLKPNSEARLAITDEDVARVVANITKVPVHNIAATDIERLQNLEVLLKKKIVGQDEAVAEIASTIRRSRLGLASGNRPLGSFIFLGPSGVGKTEIAKTLAREIYQNKNALIRVDMSEFMERHNVARLIGAPAGYVGYEEGGRLTETIRRRPYSIVLFDEIEKAHPDVFNLLLQILEEGELTDAGGRKVNFKNTVIIMTSNVGTTELNREAANFGFVDKKSSVKAQAAFDETSEKILESLKDIMRPELLNRVDKTIVFKPLDLKSIKKIVELQLKEMKERMKERNIELSWDKKVADHIADKSINPEQGARLVRRNLQDLVETPVAQSLLKNSRIITQSRHSKVEVDVSKGEIKIKQTESATN